MNNTATKTRQASILNSLVGNTTPRVNPLTGVAMYYVAGRGVTHTYTIGSHGRVIEFARISSSYKTGRLEVYEYGNDGIAKFLGYSSDMIGLTHMFLQGREFGIPMFNAGLPQ